MNIVYISSLSGNKSAGLTYSVPVQIENQSKIDNVFWYNLNPNYSRDTIGDLKCNSIVEYPNVSVANLPTPFNNPDIVVFEGFYFSNYYKIARELKNKRIPYIIIPRSSLTRDGQNAKSIKKRVANLLFFNSFARNAKAIQYLTEEEYKQSGDSWNETAIIIPNGTKKKSRVKEWDNNTCNLKGIFIGRLDIYQKGIDLLIEACRTLKAELKDFKCTIDIYGPDQNGTKKEICDLISRYGLEEHIHVYDAIFDNEKEKVLLESDFFVLTSRFEGHPMGLIEALSYGVPCLVTKGTNMLDELSDAKAGWTASTNVESITEAMRNIFREKQQLSLRGKNALALSEKYDWYTLAKKSHQLYAQLIENK
ncbi:hypothetical protein BTR22_04320 [Alkalihalophilus pseudofirmus]|uniref:glycosyltransferase n=1 Tax=Alkalihalophilus pseudofirmus TaxID=79885 RepID=UPI000951F147|nr:hypothetical protein BTR22_04320 [Alkalihalophilus pseudofirmus]